MCISGLTHFAFFREKEKKERENKMARPKFEVNDRVKVVGGRKEFRGIVGKITNRETVWDSFNKPRYDYYVKFSKKVNNYTLGSFFYSYQLKRS